MSGRSDRLRLTAEFFIADFATNYFVIAAILSASSFLDVLSLCLARSVIVRLVDLLGLRFLADRAGKGLFALCSAGGFFGHNAFVPLVSGRSDRLRLTAEFFIADFATNYFVIAAILSASSFLDVLSLCLARSVIVRLVDLLGLRFLADRAGKGLFALCSAGGFFGHNAFVPLVSGRCDRLRGAAEFFIADFATNYFVVAATLSAGSLLDVLFFCLSGSVSRCRDRLESGDRCTTNIALKSGCCSGLRTSRRYLFNLNRRVSLGIDSFVLRFLADLAGVCHYTGFFALGFGGHNTIVPLVTGRRNNFESRKLITADIALGAGCLSGFRASRRYLGNLNRGVSRCIDSLIHAADFIIAYGTIYDFLVSSINHAGRLDHIFALGFTGGMTQRIDRLSHAADYVTTDFAVNYFVVAALDCASGFDLVLTNRFGRYMTFLFDLLGFGCIAYQAGKGLYAILSAGGSSGYTAFVPLMSICRNLFNSGKYCVANAALGSGGVTLLGTGCVFCGNRNSGMHMPDAAVLIVVYGRSGFHSGSLKICAVRVAQLRGGNCDFMRSNTRTTLCILICNLLCARSCILHIFARTVGADISASRSRVHSTVYSKCTVNSYFCIHKVRIATAILLSRSVPN